VAETSLARFLLLLDYYSQPAIYMKSIKSMALIAALASAYPLSASAATITLSPYGDIYLFKCIEDHAVPDSGATVMLLGVALAGLALMRRYLRR
jgi:VPDSG-CTERM motif